MIAMVTETLNSWSSWFVHKKQFL